MPGARVVGCRASKGGGNIIETRSLQIVCADPLPAKLRPLFPGEGFACPSGNDEDELLELAKDADVLLTRGRAIDARLIEGKKLIHVMGRHPHRVDLDAAKRAGAVVATMPHGGAMAVADHTLALMLAVARKIVPGHQKVVGAEHEALGKEPAVTTEWSFAFNWLGFPDVIEINRKTLGLIGFGEIGKEVARRARGFDMDILYHQRRPLTPEWDERLGVRHASLDELFASSDIVSLHAPHTPETEMLVNRDRLSAMKDTAMIVNTSRGGLVDEEALFDALDGGSIAGAGLDVFTYEPLPKAHPLTTLDNVVLAPHTGGGSGGGQKKLIGQVLENVARFARGETPHNIVELT